MYRGQPGFRLTGFFRIGTSKDYSIFYLSKIIKNIKLSQKNFMADLCFFKKKYLASFFVDPQKMWLFEISNLVGFGSQHS